MALEFFQSGGAEGQKRGRGLEVFEHYSFFKSCEIVRKFSLLNGGRMDTNIFLLLGYLGEGGDIKKIRIWKDSLQTALLSLQGRFIPLSINFLPNLFPAGIQTCVHS